jgi:hypothetical protein
VVDGPVAEQAGLGFGGLLRRLRDEAGLTQDEQALAIYQSIAAPAGRRIQETLLRSRSGGLTRGREGG